MREFQDEVELSARFRERMTAMFPGLPIDWPGRKTEVAASGVYKGMMVRFRVARIPDSRLIATEGAIKHYRNYGSVLMQVVGPNGDGPGKVLGQVAEKLGGIFQSRRQGGMLCRTSTAGPLVEDKSTISVTVSVPYQSDYKANEEGIIP